MSAVEERKSAGGEAVAGQGGTGERAIDGATSPADGQGAGGPGADDGPGAAAQRRAARGTAAALAQQRAAARVRASHPPPAPAPAAAQGYAGLVTRALALALDSLVINGAAVIAAVVVGLALSVLHLPSAVDAAIAAVTGALWLVWTIGYFVFFWSSGGQTPGARTMHIRVVDGRSDRAIKPRRALVRFGGLILAALPLLAGFLMMLWDDRGRCLQDRLARTVVVYTGEEPETS